MKVFSGTSNKPLAELICKRLDVKLGDLYLHAFPSGERYCQYKENVRGEDVFLIQTGSNPVNDNLMELLIMADAARRASAKRITAVIPSFFYQRQDRKDKSRVPISAKLVMNMLESAGINRILTMDLHAAQIQGFTDLPVDNLNFKQTFFKTPLNINFDVIVSPDMGGIKRAQEYSDFSGKEIVIINKQRVDDTTTIVKNFIGDVNDKNVLLVDDLTESVTTLIEAAKACKSRGAKEIYAVVTHGLFSKKGVENILKFVGKNDYLINQFMYSNTTEHHYQWSGLIEVDVSSIFAEAITRINKNQSVTELFK
jgi:ribose-phosphate pyrophosphokinase